VQTRLQKILSAAGISSRRASEAMILEGRVSVNGKTVTELGSKADPDTDDIRVDGRRVKKPASRRYILMYKPRGYITSRSDPEQRPTVIDLLAKGGVRDYVYPVGRLDYESEGLLILTSDGDLAERLMHPSHEVGREYHVRVRGVPDEHAMDRLARGIVLDSRKTAPAKVEVLKVIEGTHGDDAMLSIEIHEGRNRQVRRMCEAVGHPVVRLRRVRIGPIHDEHIRPGEFRDLDEREVAALKRVAAKSRGSLLVTRSSGVGFDKAGAKIAAPTPAKRGEHRNKLPPRSGNSSSRVTSNELRATATSRRAGSPKSASGPRTRAPRPSGRPRRG
jgi:pseudouridine synthase